MCQILRYSKERLRHRYFPVDFAKSLWKHLFCTTVTAPWCSGHRLHNFIQQNQVLPRFKSCWWRVENLWWWESMTMAPAGNKVKLLSSVNHSITTILHHHHQRLVLKYLLIITKRQKFDFKYKFQAYPVAFGFFWKTKFSYQIPSDLPHCAMLCFNCFPGKMILSFILGRYYKHYLAFLTDFDVISINKGKYHSSGGLNGGLYTFRWLFLLNCSCICIYRRGCYGNF